MEQFVNALGFVVLTLAVGSAGVLIVCSMGQGYDWVFNKGFNAGHREGREEGHAKGYEEGHAVGHAKGQMEGLEAGKKRVADRTSESPVSYTVPPSMRHRRVS